jgi:hypothetical protein
MTRRNLFKGLFGLCLAPLTRWLPAKRPAWQSAEWTLMDIKAIQSACPRIGVWGVSISNTKMVYPPIFPIQYSFDGKKLTLITDEKQNARTNTTSN